MNLPGRLLACGALVSVLGAAPGPLERELRFAPGADTALQKTFTTTSDLSLDEFSLVVDGEDVGAALGGFEISVSSDQEVEVVDRYVALAEGRPAELLRTFDGLDAMTSVSLTSEFGSQDTDVSASSDLQGRTVRFRWDDDGGGFAVTYADGTTGDLLDGLEEDMDFRSLLPGRAVSEGDTWDVPLKALKSIASPGGDLKVLPDDADVQDLEELEGLFRDKYADMASMFDGTCVCTFRGFDQDQPDLAEIEVAFDLSADIDFSDVILELVDAIASESSDEEVPDITVDNADLSVEIEGDGTLLWNVAAGRFSSFEAKAGISFSVDVGASMELADESHDAELFLQMTGSIDHLATAGE